MEVQTLVSVFLTRFILPDGCGDVSHSQVTRRDFVTTRSLCALQCAQEPSCLGFNWQKKPLDGVHLCELVNSTSDEYGAFLYKNAGFSYVEKYQPGVTTCSKRKILDCVCPTGYTRLDCSCYKDNPTAYAFDAARENCRADSPLSDIVSIDNAEEAQSLKQLLLSSESGDVGGFTYLDAYDFDSDNRNYVHSSKGNATVSYTNWAPGEPNNAQEICGGFFPNTGLWHDVPCTFRLQSICEIDLNLLGCRC